MELLSRHHVSGAPVVSGGILVGVVTGNDLMGFAAALSGIPTERESSDGWSDWPEVSVEEEVESQSAPPSAFFSDLWDDSGADMTERFANVGCPEWNALEEHDLSEIMTRMPLKTLAPDATAEEAAEIMQAQNIHRVLVVEHEKLVGIVSTLDIARAAAQHRFAFDF
jgi:CBS domain-containing protein